MENEEYEFLVTFRSARKVKITTDKGPARAHWLAHAEVSQHKDTYMKNSQVMIEMIRGGKKTE